ncbi:tear acid lipase-like protein [Arvicola amphibius]|uniref:tear acid lipase-like protein n=1 Tax=Arvicola amphibius TaxID=1047088 RepID=UPI0018E298CF|nr:tear acid lipase-like protein [Arvicola amphibius]
MQLLLQTMCILLTLEKTFCFLKPKTRNPEANMNVSEVISYWGYPSEEYEVVTEDGYILSINRIPFGKNDFSNSAPKPVVYLQHGYILTSGSWVANLPNNSLGFLLADAGYDVWMGNSRGNIYARKHVYMDPNSKEFWAFSHDQIIKYDLPATIDFILQKTGQKQLYYVGHSQGTLIAFGAFSANQQLAQKIKLYFALAPVCTGKYITSSLRLFAFIPPTMFKILFGEKDFLSPSQAKYIGQFICQNELVGTICNNMLTLLFGYNTKNLNESRIDVYLGQCPAGTSVQIMLHYSQLADKGTLQAYDWGSPRLNMQHYNQTTPPFYKVENMKVPTVMWSGRRDTLADPKDVANLEPNISNLVYYKWIPDYNHVDFAIGLDAFHQVFSEILSFINEDQSH